MSKNKVNQNRMFHHIRNLNGYLPPGELKRIEDVLFSVATQYPQLRFYLKRCGNQLKLIVFYASHPYLKLRIDIPFVSILDCRSISKRLLLRYCTTENIEQYIHVLDLLVERNKLYAILLSCANSIEDYTTAISHLETTCNMQAIDFSA